MSLKLSGAYGLVANNNVLADTIIANTYMQTTTLVTNPLYVNSYGFSNIASNYVGTTDALINLTSNGNSSLIIMDTYGVASEIIGRTSQGTINSPTNTLSGDTLLTIKARGYGDTAFLGGSSAFINFLAAEDFTDTNHGGSINFQTAPIGGGAAVTQLTIGPDGTATFTGNISGNTDGYTIGYKDLPQLTTSNVILSTSDGGKHYYINTAGTYYYTLPNSANVALPIGTTVVIVNRAAANVIANTQTGVSLYLAGNTTSTNRTVTSYGMATLVKVESNVWMINGVGII
jgi:hypothetical protein